MPSTSPAPLQSCETRELTIDGAEALLQANADGSLGAQAVSAPDASERAAAIVDLRRLFGAPHPDTRVMRHAGKWGIDTLADPCGRPVTPSPSPSP